MHIWSVRRGWAMIPHLGGRSLWPHARYRKSFRLRWQRVANTRLGESWSNNTSTGGADGGLSDFAGRERFQFRQP